MTEVISIPAPAQASQRVRPAANPIFPSKPDSRPSRRALPLMGVTRFGCWYVRIRSRMCTSYVYMYIYAGTHTSTYVHAFWRPPHGIGVRDKSLRHLLARRRSADNARAAHGKGGLIDALHGRKLASRPPWIPNRSRRERGMGTYVHIRTGCMHRGRLHVIRTPRAGGTRAQDLVKVV